jgi:hypothetical protein
MTLTVRNQSYSLLRFCDENEKLVMYRFERVRNFNLSPQH